MQGDQERRRPVHVGGEQVRVRVLRLPHQERVPAQQRQARRDPVQLLRHRHHHRCETNAIGSGFWLLYRVFTEFFFWVDRTRFFSVRQQPTSIPVTYLPSFT